VGVDPGRGQHDYGGNTVVFLDQYSAETLWEGRPDSLPAARQAALLWTRPLHTGSFAGTAGTMVWGWVAVAVLALGISGYRTRRSRILEEEVDQRQWQRRLRRRRALARRQRTHAARATRTARDRRRTSRHLRRRRRVRARLGIPPPGRMPGPAVPSVREPAAPFAPAPEPVVPPEPEPQFEIDLRDEPVEIDLTDAVDIDLTEAVVSYDSLVTLETGDTLESGVIGVPPLPDPRLR